MRRRGARTRRVVYIFQYQRRRCARPHAAIQKAIFARTARRCASASPSVRVAPAPASGSTNTRRSSHGSRLRGAPSPAGALAPLAWVGMNAIGVFVVAACGVGEALVGGVYVGGGAHAPAGDGAPRSLLPWLERRVFVEPLGGAGATRTDDDALAHLLAVLAKIVFWIAACGVAHRWRWYWKI